MMQLSKVLCIPASIFSAKLCSNSCSDSEMMNKSQFPRQSINADDAKLLTKSLKEAPRVSWPVLWNLGGLMGPQSKITSAFLFEKVSRDSIQGRTQQPATTGPCWQPMHFTFVLGS